MWKKIMIISLLFKYVIGFQEYSEEFYDCINPNKITNSPSECTSISIPYLDGYKCCSMKISLNDENSYSCLAIEKEFTQSKKILDEYLANRAIGSLFGSTGGQMEIDCGGDLITSQTFEKMSNEYLGCYKGNTNGVQNKEDCHKFIIPEKEKSKCCFIESIKQDIEGNIIKDKRCYMIPDIYFTEDKNLRDYLSDKSVKNLDDVRNINLTINCENIDIFSFTSKFENKRKSVNPLYGDDDPNSNKKKRTLNAGAIVGIIIGCLIFIGATILIIYFIKKKKFCKINNNNMKDEVDINQKNL